MLVDELHRFGEVLRAHARQHRAEDLFLVDAHRGRHVVEQGAAGEEAALVSGHLVAAAIDDELRAFRDTQCDVALDALQRLVRDDRPHLGIEFHAVLDLQRLRALGQLADDLVADIADQHRHRDRHAALAGRAVGRAEQGIGRHLGVGIGHHHHVILGAAEGLYPLAVGGTGSIHIAGDRGRADKGDRLHVAVRQQRIDGGLVAVDDVQHAVGQAGLLEQLGQEQRGRRIAFGRFQHIGVAAHDRHRKHPQRHHGREIEWRDAGADADRLAQRVAVDAAADVFGKLGFQQMRGAAGEFDHLDAALQLAVRVRQHLAMFARD